MIKRFENFEPRNWERDFGNELSQLEDIFSNLDLDLNVKSIKSDIMYEGIRKKNIPKFINITFDGKNKISNIFREINKRIEDSKSFGFDLSHSLITFRSDWNMDDIEDCYGFENPQDWIFGERCQKNHFFQNEADFDNTSFIKHITIYFDPIK